MLQFDQMAIYTDDIDVELDKYQSAGYTTWVEDEVTALHRDTGKQFKARLAFNYDILPIEFELIQPLSDEPNYLTDMQPGALAHMGIHVVDALQIDEAMDALQLATKVQEVRTIRHANPEVGTRRYYYKIMKSRIVPFNVKLIERIGA